jgi:parallel beta-helix repeat protein
LLELEERRLLATFTVSSTADDGSAGTLRSVIAEVNGTPGSNTIQFDPTVFHSLQTITLSASQLELSNTSGTQTIIGPAASVNVSGGNQSRVLQVDKGVTASISGLTFTGGNASSPGGGLYNLGNSTLTDCTISGNDSTVDGGGVFNVGTASLTGCSISGNTGRFGGGLGNVGTIALADCTISQNGGVYNGGGIYNKQGTATLTNCTISSNGDREGGGVANQGTATLADCVIENNSGGGVDDFSNATATLTDCTINGNSAIGGGAVQTSGGGVDISGTANLSNCTLSDNMVSTSGGGIVISGSANVTGCTISGNSAQDGGGGLQAFFGKAYLTDCTIDDNAAPGGDGGGVQNLSSTVNLADCTISGNSSSGRGGGLFNQGTTNLTACTVSGNAAPSAGGGLFNNGTAVNLVDTIVAGNTILPTSLIASDIAGASNVSGSFNLIGTGGSDGLQNGSGGNIVLPSLSALGLAPLGYYGGPTETMALLPGSAAIGKGTFASGVATDQRGEPLDSRPDIGAFQIQPGLVVNYAMDDILSPLGDLSLREAVNLADVEDAAETITFSASVFDKLQTITLSDGDLALSDSGGTQTITGPAAGLIISGGGQSRVFQVNGDVTASISGLTISGGSTTGNGGGLYNDGTTRLNDVTLSGNTATAGAGLWNNGTLTLTDSTIAGNTATGNGGGLGAAGGTASLSDCTISGNSAANGGGLATLGTASLIDCTISANSASGSGGGLYNKGTAILQDTIVAGNTGTGSTSSDIAGNVSSSSANSLIGIGGAGGIQNGVSGNIVLSSLVGLGLTPLGSYGGPTQTMALLPGSPAIGAGAGTSGISTDERGAPRPTSGAIDIGAFQDQGYTLAVSSGSPQSVLAGQAFQAPLAATLTENFVQVPLQGVTITFSAPSSGASATLSATSAETNSSGGVSVTATAGGTAGKYTVSASATGVASPATFNLTNQTQPSFSGLTNQTATYGKTVTFTGTLSAGQQVPAAGEEVAVTVGRATSDAQIAADGSFSVQFTRSDVVLNASATAYSVSYQYATDGVFLAANGSSQLTVSPEALTITAAANSKVYDGTASASAVPTITAGSLATGDTANFTESYASAKAGTGLTLPPSGTVNDGNGGNNYTYTFVPVSTGAITPAPLSISVNNASKDYGAPLPAFTFSYSGLVNGEGATNLTDLPAANTSATAASPVGTYAITGSGAADPNYSISYKSGALTVAAVPLTITVNNASMVYGSALPAFSFSYSGFVNGDSASSLTDFPSAATAATASSPVGSYPITASAAVDPNYAISYTSGNLTITPASLTITANNASKVYGAALPAFTFSYAGFVNGDSSSSLTELPSAFTTATASSSVGAYAVTASAAIDPNYNISYASGNLTITAAELTITANDVTKIYGAALPAFTFSFSGFVSGDSASSLTTPASANTPATGSSPVGSYAITASGAVDPNYTISYASGMLKVAPAALTIAVNNASKIYGAAPPTFTFGYTGFVNGDGVSSLATTPSASTAATAASPVGSYPVTASGAVDANYNITYTGGTVTVTPAALTVTVNDASKVYAATLPAFTFSYSGFVNGDNASSLNPAPSASTSATASSAVGNYAITAGGAFDPNYNIAYLGGALSVTPAKLKITVNNASRISGQANPVFAATYSGFVNGDTAASLTTQPSFSTTATKTSPAGTYPITASGAVDANYTMNYLGGTLTVHPPLATVTSVEVKSVKSGKKTTEVIVVQFNEALSASAAQSLANYSLVTVPKSKKQSAKPVSLAGAAYNAKAFSVTLTTSKALALNPAVDLTITGARLLDALGRPLAANYSATLSKASVPVTPTAAIVRESTLSADAVDVALAGDLRWAN